MRRPVPVKASKGKTVLYFHSMNEAELHFDISKSQLTRAMASEKKIDGWLFMRCSQADEQAKSFLFHGIADEKPRYKEIFTRKPFEATGIWRKSDDA